MDYGMTKEVDSNYDDTVEKMKEELKKVGFGILTTIDVQATLKEKIGVDFNRYIILGACNPKLAHHALTHEIHIGLLLPCNVIVYEDDNGKTIVSIMDPELMVEVAENKEPLKDAAAEAKELLTQVLENI